MAAVPKRGPSPRLWLVSLVVVAIGGLLAFSWLGAGSSSSRQPAAPLAPASDSAGPTSDLAAPPSGDGAAPGLDSAGRAPSSAAPKVAPIAETPPAGLPERASAPQPKAPPPVASPRRPAVAPVVTAKPPAARPPRSDLFSDPD